MNTERKYNPNDEWYTRFVAVRRHSITPEEIDAALDRIKWADAEQIRIITKGE